MAMQHQHHPHHLPAAANRVQRRAKTTAKRRSRSETDLLREIDAALIMSKGFLYSRGMDDMHAHMCGLFVVSVRS